MPSLMPTRVLSRIAAVASLALLVATAIPIPIASAADAWPSRPIRIVAPSTPGDAPDVIARILAERLSVALGTQVFVENHPGAAGNIAAEIVATAPPDGYTLLMGTIAALAINPSLYHRSSLDPMRCMCIGSIRIWPTVKRGLSDE